jgi:hypothetical protein
VRIICAGKPIIFLDVALSCIVNTCDLVKRFTVLGETGCYLGHGARHLGLLCYDFALTDN